MHIKINWDAIGITSSLACAIHCAILPLFITSLPLFGINIIHHTGFEYGMIALAFVIGTIALYHGKKKHHHSFIPFILFFVGIILLVIKVSFQKWELFLLIPAVSCIVSAHLLNYNFCRVHNHAHASDCNH